MRVKDYELIRCNDGGEVRVWYDGQIDILKESHMTVCFREAKRRQTTPPEALRREPDPLTLELADELFGCFLHRAAPDADHSWECAVCEEPVTMPHWVTSKHTEGCAVAKARDYLAEHAPHRTPGYTPSPLARSQEKT